MDSSLRTLPFALWGAGQIARRYALLLAAHPQTACVGAIDIVAHSAAEFPVPIFPSLAELLAQHPETQVICICTPNGLHASQAIAAMESGLHVVVEKPLALTRRQCEAIVQQSLLSRRQVFCVMQNRYSPIAQWLSEVVASGILGEIYLTQVNCFWNRNSDYYQQSLWRGTADLDGGILFTQFSHFVDLLYWLFGDVAQVDAVRLHNYRHQAHIATEDTGAAVWTWQNGGLCSFQYSVAVNERNLESSLTILAQRGSIKISGQYLERVEICRIEDYELPALSPPELPVFYGAEQERIGNHHFMIQNVLDTLAGKAAVSTSALEGMKVVEIIERIYQKGRGN